MVDNWVVDSGDGTMNWEATVSVGSLSGAGDYDVSGLSLLLRSCFWGMRVGADGIPQYYISVDTVENDLKGLAAFILASIEYEQL